MNLSKTILSSVCLSVLFSSCVKDEITIQDLQTNATPTFGVPIANARISAERVIQNFDEEGLIQSGADGMLMLAYRDTFETVKAGDILNLPRQSYNESVDLSPAELLELAETGSVTISENSIFSITSSEGDRLDSMRFENGTFRLEISSAGSFPISGFFQLRSADNTTVLFQSEFGSQQAPVFIENISQFENLLVTFLNDIDVENGIRVAYELTFTNATPFNPQTVDILFELDNFEIRAAGGYISPRTISLENEGLNITMFNDVPEGNIRIEDPRLNFYFNNGFGLGLRLETDELLGTNRDGEILEVNGSQISELALIDGAAAPGIPTNSTLSINNQTITPSVTDILAFMPNYLSGTFGLTVNPENEQSVFISNDAGLIITFEAEIPIYGSIADFRLTDTTAVSLGDFVASANDLGEIKSLDIRLFVENGLPIDAGVQIIFLDSNGVYVDALFDEPTFIFLSAPIELGVATTHPNYGRATGSTETVIDIAVPRERIDPLAVVDRMIIQVFGNTTNNGDNPIRVFADNYFDVHLAAKTTISYND